MAALSWRAARRKPAGKALSPAGSTLRVPGAARQECVRPGLRCHGPAEQVPTAVTRFSPPYLPRLRASAMKRKQEPEMLLDELIELCKQGQADNEPEDESSFLKNFLPIRTHYRILEPDGNLIIGDKGSGKTQVFRALSYPHGRTALTALAARHGRNPIDLSRASWQIGFASSEKDFHPGASFASSPAPASRWTCRRSGSRCWSGCCARAAKCR